MKIFSRMKENEDCTNPEINVPVEWRTQSNECMKNELFNHRHVIGLNLCSWDSVQIREFFLFIFSIHKILALIGYCRSFSSVSSLISQLLSYTNMKKSTQTSWTETIIIFDSIWLDSVVKWISMDSKLNVSIMTLLTEDPIICFVCWHQRHSILILMTLKICFIKKNVAKNKIYRIFIKIETFFWLEDVVGCCRMSSVILNNNFRTIEINGIKLFVIAMTYILRINQNISTHHFVFYGKVSLKETEISTIPINILLIHFFYTKSFRNFYNACAFKQKSAEIVCFSQNRVPYFRFDTVCEPIAMMKKLLSANRL